LQGGEPKGVIRSILQNAAEKGPKQKRNNGTNSGAVKQLMKGRETERLRKNWCCAFGKGLVGVPIIQNEEASLHNKKERRKY